MKETVWSEPPCLHCFFLCGQKKGEREEKKRKRKGSISNTEALFLIIELVVHWLQPEIFKGASSSSKTMRLLVFFIQPQRREQAPPDHSLGHLPNVQHPCRPQSKYGFNVERYQKQLTERRSISCGSTFTFWIPLTGSWGRPFFSTRCPG